MAAGGDDGTLTEDLRDRVLETLGLSGPPAPTLDGLHALYGAWCGRVPFDNLRKMIALHSADHRPLPGGLAADFFEHYVSHGAGGTCWPSSNALYELLRASGFRARRVAGSMHDTGVVNHASVKVSIEGRDWLVDSSMLTNAPLPLGSEPFTQADPVYPAEIEPADGTHVIWWQTPPNPAYFPCRLLLDPATHAQHLAGYEASRDRSTFNLRLYARRNRPGALLVLVGRTRVLKTASGIDSRDLPADELRHELLGSIGLSDELVDRWVSCGGLAASFALPTDPARPPTAQKPPSQRT